VRIRRTPGSGASPLSGRIENRDEQKYPRTRIGTVTILALAVGGDY